MPALTPAEHRAEAERLLDAWEDPDSNTHTATAASGAQLYQSWKDHRTHYIAAAHVHALLAGPPPVSTTRTVTL